MMETQSTEACGTENGHGVEKNARVFCGTLIHSTATSPLEMLEHQVVGVDVQTGKILFVAPKEKLDGLLKEHGLDATCVTTLGRSQFLMPGLVDTHIHAPQYVYTGTALDLPLLDWLKKYTFPTESKFEDVQFATRAYKKVVRRTLNHGTTTAQYFATIHKDASLRLAEITAELGQRAFVGKVNADNKELCPEYVESSAEASLEDTEWFIQKVQAMSNPLVTPVVTPRFALSCSEQLMKGLGQLAEKYDVPIQSHISENTAEIEAVRTMFPNCKNYTDVYDKYGLMTKKTVMAHCIYLEDGEIDVFRERGSSMSHCPCSNFSLRSGVMDYRRMKDRGVKMSLGTDVSGGFHPSMFQAIRDAITASNVHCIQRQPQNHYKHLQFEEAFQLATLGGCQALGIDDKVGNFMVGKEFDALLINMDVEDSPFDIFDTETYTDPLEDMIQKFFFLGDDRNIEEVYVRGRRVKPFC